MACEGRRRGVGWPIDFGLPKWLSRGGRLSQREGTRARQRVGGRGRRPVGWSLGRPRPPAGQLCRFEPGGARPYVPGLRLADDASFPDLPPWTPRAVGGEEGLW